MQRRLGPRLLRLSARGHHNSFEQSWNFKLSTEYVDNHDETLCTHDNHDNHSNHNNHNNHNETNHANDTYDETNLNDDDDAAFSDDNPPNVSDTYNHNYSAIQTVSG